MTYLAIPYLSVEHALAYRALPSEMQQRVVASAKAVVDDDVGYRRATKDHGTQDLADLVRAVVVPIKNRLHPAPWLAPVLISTAVQNPQPVNFDPVVDAAVEAEVAGADFVREWVADGRLTATQATAVLLLSRGDSGITVAKALRIAKHTLYDWRKQPAFAEAVGHVVQERVDALLARLDADQQMALDVLREGCKAMMKGRSNEEVPDWPTRRACAESILDRGGRFLKANKLRLTASTERDEVPLEAREAEVLEEERLLEEEMRAASGLRVIEGGGRRE